MDSVVIQLVASNVYVIKAMISTIRASTVRILTNVQYLLKYVATENVRTLWVASNAFVTKAMNE
jgi:hypothetical protein